MSPLTSTTPMAQEIEKKKKSPLSRILRSVVSIALLVLLLRNTNWSEFVAVAKRAEVLYLLLGLAIVVLAVAVSAYKWKKLLDVQGVRVPLGKLFVFYLVGLFFNNFLPTNIGGDVIRIHDVSRYSGKTSEAVASVIGERLLAAFALALTAAAGLFLSFQTAKSFVWLVAVVFVVTLAVILLFAVESWRKAIGRKIRLPDAFSIRRRLGGVGVAMTSCLKDRRTVAWVMLYSIVFQLTVVLLSYVIFLALGLEVPFVYALLFIPIISAIQMLPISISGFGVREGAYVYFFGNVGLTSAEAIASSLIFWVLVALVSLVGGAVFALRK